MGGGEVAIKLRKTDKNILEISIADSGIGIPMKEQKYLFTKF